MNLKRCIGLLAAISLSFSSIGFAATETRIWSGGVGESERMEAPVGNLKLVFFVEGGAFLADLQVSIYDSQGNEQVNTRAEGPWMIVNLSPGHYRVMATRKDGQSQGARFSLDSQSQTEVALMFKK